MSEVVRLSRGSRSCSPLSAGLRNYLCSNRCSIDEGFRPRRGNAVSRKGAMDGRTDAIHHRDRNGRLMSGIDFSGIPAARGSIEPSPTRGREGGKCRLDCNYQRRDTAEERRTASRDASRCRN